MQTELLPDFLHLFHNFGSRSVMLKSLLEHFAGDPSCLRQTAEAELRGLGLNRDQVARVSIERPDAVDADLIWAGIPGNHLICYDDPAYPALLRQIADYPLMLYASGDPALLQSPQVAIVGSRQCTPGGAQHAYDFAAQLAASGLTITSGLALGIDSQAHRAALDRGKTVAVTATGLDIVYPRRNRRLASEIRERGLLISEFSLGTRARAEYFPQRNRIISGLAVATLVVEAASRSGSLITARLAAEQGREVFAVPGSIHNPQTRGCHQLIRDGARLAETPAEITGELASLMSFVIAEQVPREAPSLPELDAGHRRLLDTIGFDPVTPDVIVERSGLTIDQVSSMLLVLELNDFIQSAPGGCFVRI